MKLSEIRQCLAAAGVRLTKSLGQNFLHDANQLRRIVDAAELVPRDAVLEIGPGLGPLTERLLARAGRVLAIEKDQRLVELLRQRLGSPTRLTLVHDDALRWLRERADQDWTGWKVVSNLPYSVASPILVELAMVARGPDRMVVTVQWEVAQRIMAAPSTPDYGTLTLLLQWQYEAHGAFRIPRSCFFPEPDVDSACVTLQRRTRPLLEPAMRKTFAAVVKQGFSQRRKMMAKLLKSRWPARAVDDACWQAGIEATCRAESVSLEQFVELTRALHDLGPKSSHPSKR